MSLKWRRLVQEKLFLAESLLKKAAEEPATNNGSGRELAGHAGLQDGLVQGAIALTLQARQGLLVFIAQLNQSKTVEVAGLAGLAAELGDDNVDVTRLAALSSANGSWWQRMDLLQHWTTQPRVMPKQASDENLIAVAVATEGPDLTPQALLELNKEIKLYVTELCRWHDEW